MSEMPKCVLICHKGAALDGEVLARWLATFTHLAIVSIQEPPGRVWKRIRREFQRSGLAGLLDVLAFRLYARLRLAQEDRRWEHATLHRFRTLMPALPASTQLLATASPNSPECQAFIAAFAPDIAIARCKSLLAERIFTIPKHGTLVMHPGICPEYRNAHGCFWALAQRDLDKVGMTLLRIDRGIDTGPVYGYYSYAYDEVAESHGVIQHRVVLENLPALRSRIIAILAGDVEPLSIADRPSTIWGQPRLSAFLSWKRAARARAQGVQRE